MYIMALIPSQFTEVIIATVQSHRLSESLRDGERKRLGRLAATETD